MYCERCGVKNNDTAKNCIGCGTNLGSMSKKNDLEKNNFSNTQTFGNFSFDVEKELSANNGSFSNTTTFGENVLKEKSAPIENECKKNLSYPVIANKKNSLNSNDKKNKKYIPDYMILSLVTSIASLTCLCYGILPLITSMIALVSSMKVKPNLTKNNIELAKKYSSRAKIFGLISIALLSLSIVFILLTAVICYLNPEIPNKFLGLFGYRIEMT